MDQDNQTNQLSPVSIISLITVTVIWGANFPAMKIALKDIPPVLFVGIRFSISALLIWAYLRLCRLPFKIPRCYLLAMAVMTILFYVQQTCILTGVKLSYAGRAGVLLNTQPIVTAFMAHYFIVGDKLTKLKTVGLFLAFAGVYLIFRSEMLAHKPGMLLGDGLVLLAAMCWATQTIILKRIVHALEPASIFFYQALLASPLFFVTSYFFEEPPTRLTAPSILSIGYVTIIGSALSFAWWNYLIKHNNPSKATSICFVTPVASVVLSGMILGERITGDIALATTMVATGIFIANYFNAGLGRRADG